MSCHHTSLCLAVFAVSQHLAQTMGQGSPGRRADKTAREYSRLCSLEINFKLGPADKNYANAQWRSSRPMWPALLTDCEVQVDSNKDAITEEENEEELRILSQLKMKQSSTCAWHERDGKVGWSHCKALKLLPIFHWSPVPVSCDKTVKGLQRRHSLKAQKPKIAAAAAADMKWFEAGRATGTAALSGWRILARGARLVRKQLPWPTFYAPCEVCLWIWFGEMGWVHLFSLPPPNPKQKKWVEASSSEHRRERGWKKEHQWAGEKVGGPR